MSAATIVSTNRSVREINPEGWRKVRLGEVAEHRLGKMLDAKKNIGSPKPYLRNPNVKWFHIDISDLGEMPFHDDELDKYSIRKGDILICEGGEAGRAAIWEHDDIGVKFQKAIHRVRVSNEINARFFVHQLMYDYFNGGLNDYYTGTTIRHFTGQDLNRYEFSLPPLKEQIRIAKVLDFSDSLCQKRRIIIEKLDRLSESLLNRLISKTTSQISFHKMSDIISEYRYGSSEKSGPAGRPILRIPNVIGGSINCVGIKTVPVKEIEAKRLRLEEGDILFVRTNGNIEYVGRSAVVTKDIGINTEYKLQDFVYASYLIRGKPIREKVEPIYLQSFLSGELGRKSLREKAKTSAGQFNINIEGLSNIEVPIPPLDLQRAFAARVAEIDKLKALHRAHLAKLDELFASLQHRAFRGEL